jgi:DNA repair protein RecO (recombination protein O)
MIYALYMLDVLEKILVDKEPHQQLFYTALQVLYALEEKGYRPLPMRFFEIRVVQEMGFSPTLDRCVLCGEPNPGYRFSLADGGLVCPNCAPGTEAEPLHPETLAVLRLLSRAQLEVTDKLKVSPVVLRQLEHLTEGYLEYHFERRFAVKQAIRKLKNYYSI